MQSKQASVRPDGQHGGATTDGMEAIKEFTSTSKCISPLYQFPMESPDICSLTEDSGVEAFRHYWEHVDMSQLSWVVRACTDGYSEGMLAVLNEEEIYDILSYDEAIAVEHHASSESPDWLVVSSDIGTIQRSLKWGQRALSESGDFFLCVIVDEHSDIPDADIISHWVATGVPPESISVSRVDTNIVCSTETPWGECILYSDDYSANWLYWYWRGQKDQLARINGNSDAWRISFSVLDEMINDEAWLYDFDPWH